MHFAAVPPPVRQAPALAVLSPADSPPVDAGPDSSETEKADDFASALERAVPSAPGPAKRRPRQEYPEIGDASAVAESPLPLLSAPPPPPPAHVPGVGLPGAEAPAEPAADPELFASSAPQSGSAPSPEPASAPPSASRLTPAMGPAVVAPLDLLSAATAAEPSTQAQAQFAAPPPVSGQAMGEVYKNNKQPVAEKELKTHQKSDGMEQAYRRPAMDSTFATPAFIAAAGASPEAAPVGATAPARETSPAVVTPESQAARLIERTEEIAGRLAARPAEQVRVHVDLAADQRVELRVSLRGGLVHAEFRTDSPELRASLARAWEGFVRGSEGSSHHWAEPVFSTAAPSPVSSSGASDPSASHGFAGQQNAPRRESQESAARPVAVASARTASPVIAVPAAAPATALPSVTSRHLSAVV